MRMANRLRLVYSSLATRDLSDNQVFELLCRCQVNNRRHGVNGLLMYSEGEFFQVLEGEGSTIDALYDTIRGDSRHGDVHLHIRQEGVFGMFGAFDMGYLDIESDWRTGLNRLLEHGFPCDKQAHDPRIMELIGNFADRRVRRSSRTIRTNGKTRSQMP